MMRAPTARIASNRVTIQRTNFVPDGDGGRVLTLVGNPSEVYMVGVHPTSSKDTPAHMREEGVVYLTIHFFRFPSIKIRYLINWLDVAGHMQVLNVVGPVRPAAGDFSTWLVDCEYRVPQVPVFVPTAAIPCGNALELQDGDVLEIQ